MSASELAGSPKFYVDVATGRYSGARRMFVCDWGDIESTIETLSKNPITIPGVGRRPCNRVTVEPYSDGNAICPPITGSETATCAKVLLVAEYGERGVILDWSSFYTSWSEELGSATETVSVPVEGCRISKDGVSPVAGSACDVPYKTIHVPLLEYTVTVRKYGGIPPSVQNLIGCVNKVPFLTKRIGAVYPPGTVLYSDFHIEKLFVPEGITPSIYRCKFLVHPGGWDKVLSIAYGGFVYVYMNGSTLCYPRADLNLVLI